MRTGRPSKGAGARDQIVSTRWTAEEKKALEERYGTAAKGIRAIVLAALRPRTEGEQK
jgi:hypothetical protein